MRDRKSYIRLVSLAAAGIVAASSIVRLKKFIRSGNRDKENVVYIVEGYSDSYMGGDTVTAFYKAYATMESAIKVGESLVKSKQIEWYTVARLRVES